MVEPGERPCCPFGWEAAGVPGRRVDASKRPALLEDRFHSSAQLQPGPGLPHVRLIPGPGPTVPDPLS